MLNYETLKATTKEGFEEIFKNLCNRNDVKKII